MTDLIEAVAIHRDREAFVTLYQHFAPRVKTLLLRSGASEARAEDLAQETMLTVWHKAGSFVPKGVGAAAWIFTIARNLKIDTFRRERRLSYIVDESSAEFEAHEREQRTPEDLVTTTQMEARVREALAQFPPNKSVSSIYSFSAARRMARSKNNFRFP
jgi:RNA polymerase sigma-70 factor (ECF subfamily)